MEIKPIEWVDGKIKWLDTSLLPFEEIYRESDDVERIAKAIERMEVRGAPAIGVFAALGIALAAYKSKTLNELLKNTEYAAKRLWSTRPTAINLFWAIERMRKFIWKKVKEETDLNKIKNEIVNEALKILNEDIQINKRIGKVGSKVIDNGDTILTHCNAGAVATAGYGTALGVIRAAWEEGKKIKVIATETRPVLQGARLTVWELIKEGIPVTLITDSMVGYVMSKKLVSKVIVGADRILLSGHVINKIGTYTIAVLAARHNVPFYSAAPLSTIDLKSKVEDVVIEERDPDEVRKVMKKYPITVPNVPVINPAFDITPPELVTGIITEKGIAYKPFEESLRKMLEV